MQSTAHRCHFDRSFQVKINLAILGFFMLSASFCDPAPEQVQPGERNAFEYDMDTPDGRYKLPSVLEEISGISCYEKGRIACVQDEKGTIFIVDLEKEKITREVDFGDDADYEDITVVGKTAYILRNNGNIYRIKEFTKKDPNVKKYTTALKEKNDTEGIAYDPLTHSLLIACKGSPSIDKERPYKGYKAIYRFDLEEKELEEEPPYLVDLERLDSYSDKGAFAQFSVRIAKRLGLIESGTSFQPSGIAIHPILGEIYIISSVGKLLIVLDRRGKVQHVEELDPVVFRQPEGICFTSEGDMYISNEGHGGKGYILKFKIHER